MSSPAFSPQDIDDLDTIAKQLPQGDARREKINGLIRSYQTDLLGQKNNPQGGLRAYGSDILGVAKSIPDMIAPTGKKLVSEVQSIKDTGKPTEINDYQRRKSEGYNLPYRLAAPAVEQIGTNVGGMEQSAKEGDVGGVSGHMLAGQMLVAAPELMEHAGPPVVRGAVKGANAILEHAPGTIAGTVAGTVAHYLGAPPEIAGMAGIGGYAAGKELLPKIQLPGERFGLPPVEPPPVPETAPIAEVAPPEKSTSIPKVKAKTIKQSSALGPDAQVLNQSEALGGSKIEAPTESSLLSVGDEASHMQDLNPESVARQYMGNLSNDALKQLGKKYNIEISQAELTQKPQQGTGPGGGLSAEDIRANRKIAGPRSKFIDRIIESMPEERIKEFGDMQKEVYFQPNRLQAVGQGYGAPGTQEMVIKTFFPELARP